MQASTSHHQTASQIRDLARGLLGRLASDGVTDAETILARLVELLGCDEAGWLVLERIAAGTQSGSTAQEATAYMDLAALVSGKLAHDFGNLLTGIVGFSELAVGEAPPESTTQRYVKEVWHSARQGVEWIRLLQLFGRRRGTQTIATPLGTAVADIQEHVKSLDRPRIVFQTDLPPHTPPVRIDPESLRQLLLQLVANAYEAIPSEADGMVALAARTARIEDKGEDDWVGRPRPGPAVEITVADSGVGMTAEIRARLFREVFVTTKPRRRGLGLAVAYGIIRACDGGIRLEPHEPQGCMVKVVLPA